SAFTIAASLAILASGWAFVIVLVNIALMASYEAALKSRGAPGNLVIAYLVGSLFLFAGASVFRSSIEPLVRTGILAALAFFTTIGREITKDIEDMRGDVDRRTLHHRIASRGLRRGDCLVRRSGLKSRPLRPRGPVPRVRDPRGPRGRNVYLRRPPLGGESRAVPACDEVRDDRRPRGLPRRCVRVNVYESILEWRRKGPLHMTLLDPDKQTPPEAASLSSEAAAAGTDALMVGRSEERRVGRACRWLRSVLDERRA